MVLCLLKIKYQNIINKSYPILGVVILLLAWQISTMFSFLPNYMLPSPKSVLTVLTTYHTELFSHLMFTLKESLTGLSIAIILAIVLSFFMDTYSILYKLTYPLLIITQTIPMIAIAPLLVLWFGYGIAPKIILVISICFFPITVGLLNGFKSVDKDIINFFLTIGANKWQLFKEVKFPSSIPMFIASLKVSVSYSIVGAVVAEWLGGEKGLGVYMTRVRKSFAYDKMFAVILIIITTSLLLMGIVSIIEKKVLKRRFN